MNIKPRHKRRFLLATVILIGITILGFVFIPPLINLNKMKPVLQAKLREQTGVQTQINGDINFSMLMSATIVAHDISVPNGTIDSIAFSVPFSQIFNLQNATLNKNISVYNAKLNISDLFPYSISHEINIHNATLNFMNHDYKIVRGKLSNNTFSGQVRTQQHKYDITYENGEFVILNSNDNLHIRGTLFPDGGAAGEMTIATNNINKWFEFENPKINEPVNLSMEFNWDGGYGFDFTNIRANNYFGNIKLYPNGFNSLNFKSDNANLDMTFIETDENILNKSDIYFDLYGKIKFHDKILNHFLINAVGRDNTLNIKHIVMDNIELFGGTYNTDGLHKTKLQINNLPEKFNCIFSGTPTKWECAKFNYGDITGTITSDNGIFNIIATSKNKMPSYKTIRELVSRLGDNGTIEFTFSDMAGTFVITPKQMIPKFRYAQNITLRDIDLDLKFLPDFMKNTFGTFTTADNKKTFTPKNQQWTLEIQNNNFTISGQNFKQWLPNMDLRFLNNLPYVISGTFSNNNIGDLNIMIAGHILSGNMTGTRITLRTDELNIDKFISDRYHDNYDEQKFLMNHPLAILFDLPINLSLSADTMILNNNEYKNFVYSLKPDTEIFSISDNSRGHLLGIIEKKKFDYDISIQLNKFRFDGELLKFDTPLNIADSTITAEIKLKTSGQTANDLIYNLSGDIDITFNGGYVYGLGFDKFYASADEITVLNAEYAASAALESGATRINKIKMVGTYNNGNFETTKPFTLSMQNIDAVGALFINNRVMTGTFEFILRGTAPKPVSVEMNINEYGTRKYSINELINNLDIGYMRAFNRKNNK